MMSSVNEQIEAIERALGEDRYRVGGWQRLIAAVEVLPREERRALASRLSELSDQLHARHGFVKIPFAPAYAIEWGLLVAGVLLMVRGGDSAVLSIAGVVALMLCMQPLVKVTVGLILGVRYSYAYLWFIEPRFKMRYGTYLALRTGSRVVVQLAGSVGSPFAAGLAYLLVNPDQAFVATGCLWLFWLMVLVFVVTLLAEWFGVRKVGSFRLSLLTSPATAAAEIRKLF